MKPMTRETKKQGKKKNLPLGKVYQLLEPGPVVLLTTEDEKHPDVMAMSWHMMMEFEPPLIACIVSNRDHTYGLLKKHKECVINIPTAEIAKQVVGCGNTTGRRVDKFRKFGLTPLPAEKVGAPLVAECYAAIECRVADARWSEKYCLFVLEGVKAWIDPAVKDPRTLHHRGNGRFMVSGESIRLRSRMK
ncbi:MAG: flavin reductase family protein [Alphaproteobacteria bacterium]|nr:flavin reductase family protein [Alphaproteobacteria bacterium]